MDFSKSCLFQAKLCDGEDETKRSQELAQALNSMNVNVEKCMKIRASIENIVHSLWRVKKMKEIFKDGFNEEEHDTLIENSNIVPQPRLSEGITQFRSKNQFTVIKGAESSKHDSEPLYSK